MKKFFFLLLFSAVLQAQSFTEKYNNLNQRYEYFNSQGTLVAYKYYDSFNKAWVYKDLSETKTSNYVDPINEQLVAQTLASKDSRYNFNVQKINNEIQGLSRSLNLVSDTSLRQNISQRYDSEIIKVINSAKVDFSRGSDVQRIIDFINMKSKQIIDEEYNK